MHVMRISTRIAGPVLLLAASTLPVSAQAPQACSTPEHGQFDFWIGEWDVRTPNGQAAGSNTITKVLGGCALQESWTGASGTVGHSYNIYDRTRGVWHQTWVDNSGLLLQLEGGLEGGAMVLEGRTLNQAGEAVLQRITWSVIDSNPDRVGQLWEQSTDGGATWSTVFDGTYVRRVR
jgi:hypothetical protein